MIKKLSSLSGKTILILLVVLVAIGAGLYISKHKNNAPTGSTKHPEYLSFDGNYVFSVPKNYTVDEQSVPGAQLVYTGQITAKTLEDMYNAGSISLQQISDIADHSSKGFKTYVNDSFVSDLKKNLSTNDVSTKINKTNGQDSATITVKKDGQQLRSIYVKGGQHPAAMIAKQESDAFRNIRDSLLDVEKSDLKDETGPIKETIKVTGQQLKTKNASEIYSSAAPELRTKNSIDELKAAFAASSTYIDGNIVISGISYSPPDATGALRFTKLDKNDQQPTFGALSYKKIDGQWKLQTLTLPTPTKQ